MITSVTDLQFPVGMLQANRRGRQARALVNDTNMNGHITKQIFIPRCNQLVLHNGISHLSMGAIHFKSVDYSRF